MRLTVRNVSSDDQCRVVSEDVETPVPPQGAAVLEIGNRLVLCLAASSRELLTFRLDARSLAAGLGGGRAEPGGGVEGAPVEALDAAPATQPLEDVPLLRPAGGDRLAAFWNERPPVPRGSGAASAPRR